MRVTARYVRSLAARLKAWSAASSHSSVRLDRTEAKTAGRLLEAFTAGYPDDYIIEIAEPGEGRGR